MKSWKDLRLKIEYVPLSSLKKYEANPRVHSEEQLKALEATIDAVGFNQPIGVDDDLMILTGHGRSMVAERLGYDEVPIVKLSHLSPEQQQAYITLDNKMSDMGGWDQDLLAKQLEDLSANFNFQNFGFSDHDISEILKSVAPSIDSEKINVEELNSEEIDSEELNIPRGVCPECGSEINN